MQDGTMDIVRLGDWDSLPVELAVRILNGHNDTHFENARPRPFLDPRWRFAARAVSRQWRDIIEHPTPAERQAMGKHPHKRASVVHSTTPSDCPKWATGRVVCLTAMADWLGSDATPWIAEPEAFCGWCVRTCGATRKHAVAALIASGCDWAVDQALNHHWPKLTFENTPLLNVLAELARATSDQLARDNDDNSCTRAAAMINVHRTVGGLSTEACSWARTARAYDNWDKEAGGDVEGLIETLVSLCLYAGETPTCDALFRDLGYPRRRPSAFTLIKHGRADLLEDAIRSGAVVGTCEWEAAAMSKNAACLQCLLALATEAAPTICLPPVAQNARNRSWIVAAIERGRLPALVLCDRYGVAFDPLAAFLTAATWHRPRIMAWLWHRQMARPADPPLDLDAAAQASVMRSDKRQTSSIEWICAQGGWTPRPPLLIALVERASGNGAFECALFLIERWPHMFTAHASARDIARVFAHLTRRRGGLDLVVRFISVIDSHLESPPSAFSDWNLWPALFDDALVDVGHRWHNWVRIACSLSDGEIPSAVDVSAVATQAKPPCSCTLHDEWRHRPVLSLCGSIANDADIACTPASVSVLAPLERWVQPRPVVLPVSYRDDTVTWDLDRHIKRNFYAFLAARGLLTVDGAAEATGVAGLS